VTRRKHTKLIHEGDYAAEVEVQLLDSDGGWGHWRAMRSRGFAISDVSSQ